MGCADLALQGKWDRVRLGLALAGQRVRKEGSIQLLHFRTDRNLRMVSQSFPKPSVHRGQGAAQGHRG